MIGFPRARPTRTVVLLIVMVGALSTACTGPAEPAPAQRPAGEPAIPSQFPVGGSDLNLPVDGFDLCAPFTSPLFAESVISVAPPDAGPGSCRWRGEGVTVTLTDETGPTLAEVSNDPRYRPGRRGGAGNTYWMIVPSNGAKSSHLFLAVGPAQPQRLLHIYVETENERTPLPQPGRSAFAFTFAQDVVAATSDLLQSAIEATATPR